jgi:hypothetical protein
LPLLIGFLGTAYSFLMMIVVVILDKKAEKYQLSLSAKKQEVRKLPSFKDLKNLNPVFFFLAFICAVNYTVYMPLSGNLLTIFRIK